MAALDRAVVAWMRVHHGTITNESLAALGVSVEQRDRLVASGVLGRIVVGGYCFGGVEVTELARCAAICTARPTVVVAGPTAARLWDLRRAPRDGLVHIVAVPGSHPCSEPWVRTYRTSTLHPHDVVARDDGIRVTTPPRTLLDLTRYVDENELRSAIEHALERKMCTAATLDRLAAGLDAPGRPWVRRFRSVLAQRHPGRAAESEWEMKVFDAMIARGVGDLERQVIAAIPGLGTVRFDAAVPALRWAVEIDVHPWHRSVEGASRDRRRDRLTAAAGWITHRTGEDELRHRFSSVIDELVRSLVQRRSEVGLDDGASR